MYFSQFLLSIICSGIIVSENKIFILNKKYVSNLLKLFSQILKTSPKYLKISTSNLLNIIKS